MYIILEVKKYWNYCAAGIGWKYRWYVKMYNDSGVDWELTDYCEKEGYELVCVSRGWFGWYATLKEI